MKVIVKGIHLRVSQRLRAYVDEHLVAPIEHFCDNEAAEIDVHLVDTNGPKGGVDKDCRVTIRMPRTKAIHITESSDDIYKSVALARDRLERLIKREIQKKRPTSTRRPGKPASRMMEGRP